MDWSLFINEEKKKPYFKELQEKVKEEYLNYTCYPSYKNIF